jgi:hypothetical protein
MAFGATSAFNLASVSDVIFSDHRNVGSGRCSTWR